MSGQFFADDQFVLDPLSPQFQAAPPGGAPAAPGTAVYFNKIQLQNEEVIVKEYVRKQM